MISLHIKLKNQVLNIKLTIKYENSIKKQDKQSGQLKDKGEFKNTKKVLDGSKLAFLP
jgi:hypothetical protein